MLAGGARAGACRLRLAPCPTPRISGTVRSHEVRRARRPWHHRKAGQGVVAVAAAPPQPDAGQPERNSADGWVPTAFGVRSPPTMPVTTDPSAPRRRRKRRLLAALLVAAVTLLAFEGAVSAAGRGSFLRSLPRLWNGGADADAGRPLSDEERRRAAAENPGIWRAHPDPRVGYVLRSRSDLAVGEGTIRSDGLGLRQRAGPPMPSDALRVAVLGASI